jgi:glycine cleavage system regulatory protein
VELLDRLGGVLFCGEPNECEASGASAFTVLWNVNVNDLTDLTEELTKLLVRRGEVEVPYEYLT